MANRMQLNIRRWVKPSQTRFVKDRYILDNIFLIYEAMEWAQESQQDLVILMINFEKAYDWVNWTFLKATMEKLGFNREWIAQTLAFYEGAKTSVLVNRSQTQEFDLERGVCQGCPMAPYLFFFVQDVLRHMLSD